VVSKFVDNRLQLGAIHVNSANITVHQIAFQDVDSLLLLPDGFMERESPGPVIVFIHGGGWVVSSAASYLDYLYHAVEETGYAVMSPDYRLAPKYPFPIPFEDCVNSLFGMLDKAAEYNIDSENVIIAGDSAGGNLALATVLKLIDMNDEGNFSFMPKMLAIAYPVTQMVNFQLPSMLAFQSFDGKHDMLPRVWLSYLGLHDNTSYSAVLMNNNHIDISSLDENQRKLFQFIKGENVPTDVFADRKETLYVPPVSKISSATINKKLTEMAVNPYTSPLMASDKTLSKFMRIHMMLVNDDQLRDEGMLFYSRLKTLGVDVSLQFLKDSPHACLNVGSMSKSTYHYSQNSEFFKAIKAYVQP